MGQKGRSPVPLLYVVNVDVSLKTAPGSGKQRPSHQRELDTKEGLK